MAESNRIYSIDIMRGFTLILMLFVNDLHMEGIPAWLGHRAADFDGIGLADIVFPAFLFMVGMSVPFSVGNRIGRGENNSAVSQHILIRTISLLIIGVLMSNSRAVNGEYTGMSKSVWSMIMYSGVFLIWFNYKLTDRNRIMVRILQIVGLIMIVAMVYIFRGNENRVFSWRSWGILGTIGWGYLVTAFTYLAFRNNIGKTAVIVIFFLIINIFSKLHLLEFLNPVKPVFGVIINGNAPFIVLSGMLITLILKKYAMADAGRTAVIIAALGIVSIIAGLILRNWILISKIQSTPSWGLLCNGISMLLFALFFWIIDIRKSTKWSTFLKPAGENSLTIYLVPDMFYYLIWSLGLPLLFYKSSGIPLVIVGGSIVWSLIMGVGLAFLLKKIDFRLKL